MPVIPSNTDLQDGKDLINAKFDSVDAEVVGKVSTADLANPADVAKGDAYVGVKRTEAGSVARTLHDVMQERAVSVADFGVTPAAGATTQTVGFNAVFALQKPVVIPAGNYTVNATLKPNKNKLIIGLGTVKISALISGTYDECHPASGAATGKFCVWDMLNMHNTRMEGITIWGSEDGSTVANRVIFGSTAEKATSEADYSGKQFSRVQAWAAEWAIYAPSSGALAFGVLTGTRWEHFESHTQNGVLAGLNQDDIAFVNARIIAQGGIGVHRYGATPMHFESSIVMGSGGTTTCFELEPGAQITFNSLFCETLDGLIIKPFVLKGTTDSFTSGRSAVMGQGLQVNSPDGTIYFDLTTAYNTVDVRGIRNKDWNGARATTKLVKLNFTTGAATENHVYLDYLGVDANDLISLPDSTAAYNVNNRSVIEIKSQTDHKKYIGILSTPIKPMAWIAPTLTNSWVNFGGSEETAGYYKDAAGIVHLKGLIKSGTLGSSAFNLPANYRPKTLRYAVAFSNAGASDLISYVALAVSGNVIPTGGGNTYFNLSGISFRAEA